MRMMISGFKERTMSNISKQPPLIEDLRAHSAEQLAELRVLLGAGIAGRPDKRRPGFFEIDGVANVYYVCHASTLEEAGTPLIRTTGDSRAQQHAKLRQLFGGMRPQIFNEGRLFANVGHRSLFKSRNHHTHSSLIKT